MKAIINWLLSPFQIVRSELQYLSFLKKQETTTKEEKKRIAELQSFNLLLFVIYSLFFIAFFAYIVIMFAVNWIALFGVFMWLMMMSLTKLAQEKRYLKRRDAYIKKDPTLIKS